MFHLLLTFVCLPLLLTFVGFGDFSFSNVTFVGFGDFSFSNVTFVGFGDFSFSNVTFPLL